MIHHQLSSFPRPREALSATIQRSVSDTSDYMGISGGAPAAVFATTRSSNCYHPVVARFSSRGCKISIEWAQLIDPGSPIRGQVPRFPRFPHKFSDSAPKSLKSTIYSLYNNIIFILLYRFDLDFLRRSCALRKFGWEPREPGNRDLKTIGKIFMIILLIFLDICILYRTFRMSSYTHSGAGEI